MPATFTAYTPAGAPLDTIAPSDASWQEQAGEDGSGQLTAMGDIDAALLAETTIIRVNDGTRDVFAFVPTSKTRRQVGASTELDLSGPGVRWLLHAGQVLQEDTSDCAEPADARWFGWMASAFDDSAWTAPHSFGSYLDSFWVTARPEGWPAPFAEYISVSDSPISARHWGARATITIAAEGDYIPVLGADDEARMWIDGTEITDLSTWGGGPFQWKRWKQRPIRLCAGNHTIAIEVRNLERASEATNYTWLIFALAPANSTGELRSANQIYNVYHDHSAGTFTLTTEFGYTTAAIAFDAAAATVQAALEAIDIPGAGNVTVSGSGTVASPWEIEFIGDVNNMRVALSADGSGLSGGTGIEVDENQRGRTAGSALSSNATDWVVKDFSTGVPGMTPGHILDVACSEVEARGESPFDDFAHGYTAATDSDVEAWNAELSFPLSLPADVHRLAVVLEEHGYQVDMAPGLTLNCWNDRGSDLTASVTLAVGTAGITNVQATRDETALKNLLRYRTDEGWHEASDATSVTARKRWEEGLSLEGFDSEANAAPIVAALLDDYSTPPRSTSLEIASEAAIVPYDAFGMSDIPTAPAFSDAGFDATGMKVAAIGGRVEERSIVWTVGFIEP